jgi:glutamyl-tRNA synthetase
MSNNIRVRFAPSPTGWLHIGGLRTALFNYLFARHHGGTFILRIEDTDQARYVEGAEQDIINSLKWSGIEIDEGPGSNADFGPYRQSDRSEIYKKYADELLTSGHAYYAFDSSEEIEAMREKYKTDDDPNPKYDSRTRLSMQNSLTLSSDEVKKKLDAGEPFVIRLKVPENETIRFEDEIRGVVSFESAGIDDQVLMKSDGLPTYHLANVVDDHLMQISHVIRGEEWLSSTPKHLILYNCFGWTPPKMAHLPLIMSPSGGKLSKRKAEEQGIKVNVKDYIERMYEPEALVNFLAFLGWSPGDDREIMSMKQLCDEFTLDRVSKAGAIYNVQKLHWYNEQYLREKSPESILPQFREILQNNGKSQKDDAFLTKCISLLIERVSVASELVEAGEFLFDAPTEYDEKSLKKAWKEGTSDLVTEYKNEIESLSDADFSAENLKELLTKVTESQGVGFGKLMLPIRIAVTGLGSGPDLFQTMEILGKTEVIKRLQTAIQTLG